MEMINDSIDITAEKIHFHSLLRKLKTACTALAVQWRRGVDLLAITPTTSSGCFSGTLGSVSPMYQRTIFDQTVWNTPIAEAL
jgi:hypothetical protein